MQQAASHYVGVWGCRAGIRQDLPCLYVMDCSAETLLAILKTRILPGITIISNCRGAYIHLNDEEPHEGSPQPVQQKDTLYLLPHGVFGGMCHAHHVDPFTMFVHIIRNADW